MLPFVGRVSYPPSCLMLIGPPGVGKSTWLKNVRPTMLYPVTVLSTDDLIEAWGATHDLTYNESFQRVKFKQIERDMFAMMDNAIERDASLIVDRTNMNRNSRARFLNRLPPEYLREAMVFDLPRDELDRRLTAREATGKIIPPVVVATMLKGYEPPTSIEFQHIWTA